MLPLFVSGATWSVMRGNDRQDPTLALDREAEHQSDCAAATRSAPAALCVFDVLLIDGEDLRRLPLSERKERLAALVETIPGLQLARSLPDHGEALFAQACDMDLEGIVGKDLTAPYKRGVQPTWVKIKNPNYSRQEAPGFR